MIDVFKIFHGYYDNINNISLLPHVYDATRGNKYKLCQVLLNMLLESTISLM